ncbi:hypothetical protein [Sphingomonas sp. 10B4]|uniref:hypothetical protein n=1 Tax=Sphingomonas sp. 10B4 TaxID=3048575 RepID=UPI002AB4A162|nr:hypothetical protein [Sphingomonas sp. 10B4]MDY7525532.1 hypothetical protein [Sphingomonas sp. 10B4]MEB0281478.1 hypothetical protein [Sphingomonas sp. 10B4]
MTPPEAAPMREDVNGYEESRHLLAREIVFLGKGETNSGFNEMAEALLEGKAVDIPSWVAMQAMARLIRDTARPDAGDEVERVARAKEALRRWHRDTCYPDAQDFELDIGLNAALAAMREEVDRGMVERVDATMRAALQDIADAEAIPNDAVAFVWCRDVARVALATASKEGGEAQPTATGETR